MPKVSFRTRVYRYTQDKYLRIFNFKIFRKFFENLGPIKIKNKKKEDSKLSLEDKIGFWLPATPPSQRTEDIFVGKKFLKDRVYYYNYWYHGNVFLR